MITFTEVRSGRCPSTDCEQCGEKMIHLVNRKGHESASGLGQIVHDWLPRKFAFADLDGVIERTRGGKKLIREIEQKQAGHKFEGPQRAILKAKAEMYEALKSTGFTFSDGSTLAPESGVYLIRADITPDLKFGSEIEVENIMSGAKKTMEPLEFLIWLASRKDERDRGEPWVSQEFTRKNLNYETLSIADVIAKDT